MFLINVHSEKKTLLSNILSRASEVGSPANHLGSRRNTHVKNLDRANLVIDYQKLKKNGPYTGPVLPRQGEPDTSQYKEVQTINISLDFILACYNTSSRIRVGILLMERPHHFYILRVHFIHMAIGKQSRKNLWVVI